MSEEGDLQQHKIMHHLPGPGAGHPTQTREEILYEGKCCVTIISSLVNQPLLFLLLKN